MHRRGVLIGTILATMILSLVPSSPALAGSLGEFFYPCSVTQSSGGYDYVGNCRVTADKSGYRYPTLYKDGVAQAPNGTAHPIHLYYRDPGVSGTVQPFPAGLQIRAGDPTASSAIAGWTKKVFWQCGDTKATTHYALPPTCINDGDGLFDTLTLIIKFPYCWDGTGLATADMAYPKKGSCPAAFPVLVPQVQLHVQWALTDGAATNLSIQNAASLYGEHAWFANGWDTAGLTDLIKNCIQAGVSCHE